MTTPAGWYDDGSGRQRWWDGTQWTEHFAPAAEPAAPAEATPAAEETEATIASAAAVETSWSAAPSSDTPAEDAGAPDANAASAGEGSAAETALPETEVDPVTPPEAAPTWSAPGATGPTTPLDAAVPPYGTPAPTYPGAAAQAPTYPGAAPQAPAYPGATPSYPGGGYQAAAPGYPVGGYQGGYAAVSSTPPRLSVLGLVGLGLAAVGTILAFIPIANVFGFVLLAAGFITSLISLFLKGRKWPGITGLIVSVVGTIIGVVMIFVFTFVTLAGVVRDYPTAPPSSESDSGTDDGTDGGLGAPEVVEGTMGEAVTVTQLSGSGEVTVNSATWATSDGSSIPATNGGFVILDVTWTGVDGTSYVNPIYFGIETAEGTDGTYDFFADGQFGSEELAAGESVNGTVTFDVAQSTSYTVIVTDELLQEVARISVTATAG
ncbi:DUF2510 domain-containing protein [Microbacterium maritypicum]